MHLPDVGLATLNRGEPVEIEELRIDPGEVQAFVDGKSAGLTATEFRLLYYLALDRGRVMNRAELLERVWGRRETHRDRTVDVFVRRLRAKIDRVAPRHTFIQTRYGVGYKLDAETKDVATHGPVAGGEPQLTPALERVGRQADKRRRLLATASSGGGSAPGAPPG
jgi:DNA-binding winged helix-turn-helix (wHTH) protein